jgi:hypothetical protein
MRYDTASQPRPSLPMPTQEQLLTCVRQNAQALMVPSKRRGRPASLSGWHLCLGIVLCGLRGFGAHLGLWRLLCLEPIGPFLPVHIVDQAVYNRLARAAGLMRALFVQGSRWMGQQLDGLQDRSLAPFASQV